MYKKSIEKEEINKLPKAWFEGTTHVIVNEDQYQQAIAKLRGQKLLGFDTETRPAFRKGEVYDISMLQLATENEAFLFRLHMYPLQKEVVDILANETIIKAGVAVRDDIKGLKKLAPHEASGFVELADLAKKLGIKQLGLRSLTAMILDQRLSKKNKLTNWEQKSLNTEQLGYAATDAWLGLRLYQRMRELIVAENL